MTIQKRYICSFCARSFSRSEHKLRHERSHTKEKPFKCNICLNGFVRRDLLQRHLRTVHRLMTNSLSDINEIINAPDTDSAHTKREEDDELTIVGSEMHSIEQRLGESSTGREASHRELHNDLMGNSIASPPMMHIQPLSSFIPISGKMDEELDEPEHHDRSLHMDEGSAAMKKSPSGYTGSIASLNDLFGKLSQNSETNSLNLDYPISNYFLVYANMKSDVIPLISISKLLLIDIENNHDIELIFIALCFSSIYLGNLKDSIRCFNKSWNILIQKIKDASINYNSGEGFYDFINNLILLSYIHLNYYSNYKHEEEYKNLCVTIDILFEYLNNIVSTQITYFESSKNTVDNESSSTSDASSVHDYFWHCYILLSHYAFSFNKSPASLHLFLLDKELPGNTGSTLNQLMKHLSIVNNNNADSLKLRLNEINSNLIICCLINELQLLKFNESNSKTKENNRKGSAIKSYGLFKDNRNFLHNSIILANKAFNSNLLINSKDINSLDNVFSESESFNDNMIFNLLLLTKKRIILNCPLKFTDLLSNYLVLPNQQFNWILLSLTLKEFLHDLDLLTLKSYPLNNSKFEFNINNFVSRLLEVKGNVNPSSAKDTIIDNIAQFINYKVPPRFIINNNLGITSLPLLFISLSFNNNADFLKQNKSFFGLPVNNSNFADFVISNYLILLRILLNYKKKFFKEITISSSFEPSHRKGNSEMDIEFDEAYYDNNEAFGNSNNSNSTNNNNNADETEEEDESCILAVLVYVILQLGKSNVTDDDFDNLRPSSIQMRSNSISIGEFSNNNEKLKHMKFLNQEDPSFTMKKSNKFYSLKEILLDDFQVLRIVKNIEFSLNTWLQVLEVKDSHSLNTFTSAFHESLDRNIYSKLYLNRLKDSGSIVDTPSGRIGSISIAQAEDTPIIQEQLMTMNSNGNYQYPSLKPYRANEPNLLSLQQRHNENYQNFRFTKGSTLPQPQADSAFSHITEPVANQYQVQYHFQGYSQPATSSTNSIVPPQNSSNTLSGNLSPTSPGFPMYTIASPSSGPVAGANANARISLPPINQLPYSGQHSGIESGSAAVRVVGGNTNTANANSGGNNRLDRLILATLAADRTRTRSRSTSITEMG